LYTDIWDNKPPLLYLIYALFNSDLFSIRLVSLLFGITSTIFFFLLSRKLFSGGKANNISTIVFALLFSTPYLEGNIANAENFMLLPVIAAGFFVYRFTETKPKSILLRHPSFSLISSHPQIFILGIILGLTFLLKTVAVFDFCAFLTFFLINFYKENPVRGKNFSVTVKQLLRHTAYFLVPSISGFLLPILLTFLYFTLAGSLNAFIQAVFFGNITYVGYGNDFIIPQGFLVLKTLLFLAAFIVVLRKGTSLAKPMLFILVWFLFALFSAFFSQRPYTHYLLVLLPSFCLLVGALFASLKPRLRIGVTIMILITALVSTAFFQVYGIKKTIGYYQNVISFLNGHKSVSDYQAFFDADTPRDYELVTYIKHHTTANDQIYIWGDSPQIYALSNKLPPNKYTVSYHILEHANAFEETQEAIDKTRPKFIITLSEAPPLPFRLPNYAGTYGIKGAAIYERTF
jgi:hypothetical protein